MTVAKLTDADYRRLLELRDGLRRFLRWSETQAVKAGMTPAQHQLLLAIRGHGGERPPTVGELADHLMVRHHSLVQLLDRAANVGLIRREQDAEDHRFVHVVLTDEGAARLERLAAAHMQELSRLLPQLKPLLDKDLVPAR
ncbi:MAG TPA: MarR family transcriptional regulator [Actinomycetota bacterium]|jgi:DNA-binding MarR family transcriptional regulator